MGSVLQPATAKREQRAGRGWEDPHYWRCSGRAEQLALQWPFSEKDLQPDHLPKFLLM